MKTIYLCGPINGCTDEECRNWREYVKERTKYSCYFEYLDPMRRDYRGKEAESVNEIVTLDKIDIANSDAILVNYDKPSVGTSMEVYIAFSTGKLVVVVAQSDAVVSPWLRYHSHKIAHSFDEAVSFVTEFFA
jgi:nucleoside 2-deoxyribosyltransferase